MKRYQICENDKYILTDYIEVLELVKLSPQKNIDNIEIESDKSNNTDLITDKEYDERDQIE